MRPVLIGELVALARVLRAVAPACRMALARRVLTEARAADRHRRLRHKAHARFGDGTLMSAAMGYRQADESFASDPEFCHCLQVALAAIAETQGLPAISGRDAVNYGFAFRPRSTIC
jgi:hypothetical protein